MRPTRFVLQPLLDLFERLRAVTMPEMKAALGTQADATVFRKLATLSYQTSYSHRGGFYTLRSIPRFNAPGLWCCRGAWFSRQGTLLDTAATLVEKAPAGYLVGELERVLQVPVKDALRQLAQAERLRRQDFHGRYLYLAGDRARHQEQWAARQAQEPGLDSRQEEFRAARVLFYSLLDEQQRRLYAGLESFQQGHGGDRQLAEALGLDEGTVARGRRELLAAEVQPDRVRRVGGGRPRAEKNARPLEPTRPPAPRGHGGRPDGAARTLDGQTAATNRRRTSRVRHYGQSQHRAATARPNRLCLARQLQVAFRGFAATR